MITRVFSDGDVLIRYSPDQPRDEHGRFGEGDGSSESVGPGSARDLTGGNTGSALARDAVRAAAKAEDAATGVGPRGDERLRAICERQGFDGQPTVVSSNEMDRLIADGHIEVFRGVADDVESGQSGVDLAEQFRTGDLHYGNGTFGNGTYTTTDEASADQYALHGWRNEQSSGQPGETMRMAISPDARIVDYADLQREQADYLAGVTAENQSGSSGPADDFAFLSSWRDIPDDDRYSTFGDIGRFAAARGYDVVRIPAGAVAGGEGHYQYNILNRTAVTVQR